MGQEPSKPPETTMDYKTTGIPRPHTIWMHESDPGKWGHYVTIMPNKRGAEAPSLATMTTTASTTRPSKSSKEDNASDEEFPPVATFELSSEPTVTSAPQIPSVTTTVIRDGNFSKESKDNVEEYNIPPISNFPLPQVPYWWPSGNEEAEGEHRGTLLHMTDEAQRDTAVDTRRDVVKETSDETARALEAEQEQSPEIEGAAEVIGDSPEIVTATTFKTVYRTSTAVH